MPTSPPSSSSRSSSADSTCLSLAAASPVCERVRLVGDDREALALRRGQFLHRLQREGEGLDGADDDLLAARQRLRPARRSCCRASPLMVATTPAVRSKSKIASCSCASSTLRSRDHQHACRTACWCCGVVQVGQEVRGPGDRVGLARAGRVLDQVLAARPVAPARPPPACRVASSWW